MLRKYDDWAWAVGIALIWADLVLPVPQTVVIAALGIIYGTVLGGLLGSVGLITGGLLGYVLMLTSARRIVRRFVGLQSLNRMEGLFERAGAWAIVLTRSLPYSIPEAIVFLAGLAAMPMGKFTAALADRQRAHRFCVCGHRCRLGRPADPGTPRELCAPNPAAAHCALSHAPASVVKSVISLRAVGHVLFNAQSESAVEGKPENICSVRDLPVLDRFCCRSRRSGGARPPKQISCGRPLPTAPLGAAALTQWH